MKKIFAVVFVLVVFAGVSFAGDYVYKPVEKSTKLERSTPELNGINPRYLLDTINAFDACNVEIHAIIAAVGDKVIFEGYCAPYTPEDPHIMFSLTKLFTNTAAGVAVTEGKLSLEDNVFEVLKDYVKFEPDENQKAMKLKHLLTMTSGVNRMLSGSELRPLKTSWVEHVIQEPLPNVPGEKYVYSSGNSVLTSAMITKTTGMTALEVLEKSGFSILGIKGMIWDLSPEGMNAGHGGVKINVEDILKIGILYMNGGVWNGKRVLSKEWCDRAIGFTKTLNNQGPYAFHWTAHNNGAAYTAGGSYGQTLCIVPELNMTIAVTAGTTGDVYEVLYDNLIAPSLKDKALKAELSKRAETLNLQKTPAKTASPVGELVDDVVFTASENEDGVQTIKLDVHEDYIDYVMTDYRGTHVIRNGIGSWIRGTTSMTSSLTHHQYQYPVEPVSAYSEWVDDDTLVMTWRWPQLAFVDTLVLKFGNNGNDLSVVRSVNVNSGPLVRPAINLKASK